MSVSVRNTHVATGCNSAAKLLSGGRGTCFQSPGHFGAVFHATQSTAVPAQELQGSLTCQPVAQPCRPLQHLVFP